MRRLACIIVTLCLAACSRPDPSQETAAPPSGEPSTTTEAAEREAPARLSGTPAESDAVSSWVPCHEGLVASVRSYPLMIEGVETTLGDRVDGGAVTAVIDGLDPTFTGGTWWCRVEASTVRFQYRALMNDVEFGPEWFTPEPNQLVPTNLLAEAVNGSWTPIPGTEERVRNTMLDCTAGSTPVTSGAFIHIMNDEQRPPDATDTRWTIIPHERREADSLYRVVLDWPTTGGGGQATWLVSTSSAGCEPVGDIAATMIELAAGVPDHEAQLAAGSPQPTNQPFAQPSERGRALAYTFAQERELATIADWLEFHRRLTPYETGDWDVEGRTDEAGTRAVSLAVSRPSGPVRVSYRVDLASGEAAPESVATALARGVLPRPTPGVGPITALPTYLPQEAIDEALASQISAFAVCIRASPHRSVSFRWSIAWDGHAFGVSVTPPDADLMECFAEVLGDIEFPRFAGPPVTSTSELSLVQ